MTTKFTSQWLLAITLCSTLFLSACSKGNTELNTAEKKKAEEFKTAILNQSYKLVSFYADKPIDYDANDGSTALETDLWKYVKLHVKDDQIVFPNGADMQIHQNTSRCPGFDGDIINMRYGVGADDKNPAYFSFVDFDYRAFTYEIQEVGSNYFVIRTGWNNNAAKLYSRYEKVN